MADPGSIPGGGVILLFLLTPSTLGDAQGAELSWGKAAKAWARAPQLSWLSGHSQTERHSSPQRHQTRHDKVRGDNTMRDKSRGTRQQNRQETPDKTRQYKTGHDMARK